MKVGDRDYTVQPQAGAVALKVKAWGMVLAEERVTPAQARELARELDAAADAAQGGTL